jgi:RNA polymerase sigma factor (sigma-70 family)
MRCSARDDEGALFERLFSDHSDAIYRFCLRRARDHELAEDARSTVFVEAWRRRSEIDLIDQAPRPWLYGVARNVLRNQWRSSRRYADALLRVPVPRADLDSVEEIAERADAATHAAAMRSLLSRLSPGERAVVLLCMVHGTSYAAAASELGLPLGTVRSRLFRARGRLNALAVEMGLGEDDARSGAPSPEIRDLRPRPGVGELRRQLTDRQ